MTGYQSKKAAAQGKLESMEREALKLALEALELLTDTEQTFGALDYGDNAITAIKEALAQPAQEPVGKFAKFTDGIWREVTDGSPGVSLYTAPPQQVIQSYSEKHNLERYWVGLTAEEAAECWITNATQTWKNFEAKLKEKNA